MLKKASTCLISLMLVAGHVSAAPLCGEIFHISKGHPFDSLEYKETALKGYIPESAWQGTLMNRQKKFLSMYPNHAKVVRDVHFKYKEDGEPVEINGFRDVMVISTKDAPASLVKDYLDFISTGTISFPLSRRGGHLHTRFGSKTFDHLFGMKMNKEYPAPSNFRIETIVQLSPAEMQNLATYVKNAEANYEGVIGKWDYNGNQRSEGRLDSNVCATGHNCTSYLATAGIGNKGQTFLELMGGDLKVEVGTNPGWLSLFLNTQGKTDRVPFTVFWTPNSLKESLAREVKPFQEIKTDTVTMGTDQVETIERNVPWDFYPH